MMPTPPATYLERMALRKLLTLSHPDNPKAHDIDDIARSVRRFGFVAVPTLDEATQTIVAGHGRIKALAQLQSESEEGDELPTNITLGADGDWLVPVLRGMTFATKFERDAYLIADNQHTISSGWDDAKLRTMLRRLKDQRPSSIGFRENQMKRFLDHTSARGKAAKERVSAGLKFKVVVACKGETDQAALMERLEAEGYTCSPLIS